MANKTIVATFPQLETARDTINRLIRNHCERQNIGLAVNDNDGEALIAVTIDEASMDDVLDLIKQYDPNQTDVRETGWRQHQDFGELRPDASNFKPVELSDNAQ